ncbi:MAG: protein translocase subunit SecF, partial [Proteobacteria bacterium]|nr:protein translocase subunit SecF [Pseudomonadota bacterium]
MEFFKIRRTIPFMRHALVFNIISLVTFLLAVAFLVTKGLHFSVEFTGGTVMEISYKDTADVDRIRSALDE